jgi:hypothetical protein
LLRRARVRGGKPGKGEILAKGDLAVAADAPFDPLLGVEIAVTDTLALDRVFVFAPAECARFTPVKAKPGLVRFDLRFQKLTLTEPFAPALLVRITTDPPSAPLGVDRVGTLSSCRVTTKALICVAAKP